MKNRYFIILVCCYCVAALPVVAQTIPAKLDSLLDAYAKVWDYSGSVLVATKSGVLLEKGYGYKNKGTRSLNDTNTIFQIGSITKQFTSAIILQLEEQKKLSLQDSLTKYIPDYPNGNKITIDELLTHTAGVYNYTNDAAFMKSESTHPISRDSLIARFKYKPLDFTPGEKFSYSNSGYELLGYIIEKVTGESYFQAVRERIFHPLHMDHSGFDFTDLHSPDKALGYTPQSTTPVPIVDSSVSFAAGAIYTTVGDLYKWDRGLLSEKILSRASQQKGYTPHLANYGYGWMINVAGGKKIVEHGGGITGFVSYIKRIPEDETCIIILDNQPGSANLAKMAQDIADVLSGKDVRLPKVKVAVTLDTALLQQYVGRYQIGANFIFTITLEDGHLYGQATGQGKMELFAEKKDLFFTKVPDGEIQFARDADGKIEKLILHTGHDIPAKRL